MVENRTLAKSPLLRYAKLINGRNSLRTVQMVFLLHLYCSDAFGAKQEIFPKKGLTDSINYDLIPQINAITKDHIIHAVEV